MKENINTVFELLKLLDIKATPHNVSIMANTYNILRDVYEKIPEEKENKEEGVCGAADHE